MKKLFAFLALLGLVLGASAADADTRFGSPTAISDPVAEHQLCYRGTTYTHHAQVHPSGMAYVFAA